MTLKQDIADIVFRSAARLRRTSGGRSGAAVVTSGAWGAIGDDAMVTAIVSALDARGETPVDLVAKGDPAAWPDMGPGVGAIRASSVRDPGFWLGLGGLLGRRRSLYVMGADVIDGAYGLHNSGLAARSASLAVAAGCGATILGCSCRAEPAPGAMAQLRAMPESVRLCARDPVSRERFERHTGRPVEQVADVAFLLTPDPSHPTAEGVRAWADGQRSAGRRVLAVNVNPQGFEKKGGLSEGVAEPLRAAHAETLARLLRERPGLSVLLVPHDTREPFGDEHAAGFLHGVLAPEFGERVRLVKLPLRADVIKAIAGCADAVLAGRMHFTIAALGMGVPTACVTYVGKFDGLFELVGLPRELLVSPAGAADAGVLHAAASSFLDGLGGHASSVASALPRVKALAMRNFDPSHPVPEEGGVPDAERVA